MIIYDRIKGLSQPQKKADGTEPSGDEVINNGLFTYITFSQTEIDPSDSKNNFKADFLPDVGYSVGPDTNADSQTKLGKIISSAAVDQSIDTDFVFNKRLDVRGRLWVGDKNSVNNEPSDNYNFVGLSSAASDWGGLLTLEKRSDTDDVGCLYLASGDNGNEPIYVAQFDTTGQVVRFSTLLDSKGYSRFNKVTVGNKNYKLGDNDDRDLYVQGAISSGAKVEAPYFNATSDERAKSNIQPANFDATSIVNDLPIYTFRYKDSDAPSVGIIAQEAKELDGRIKDFSLVDNPNASGENGDYMTIKESKLVYILWKANQELSARVSELEKQIAQLKAK